MFQHAAIARLTAERDEWKARAESAERKLAEVMRGALLSAGYVALMEQLDRYRAALRDLQTYRSVLVDYMVWCRSVWDNPDDRSDLREYEAIERFTKIVRGHGIDPAELGDSDKTDKEG